MPQVDKITFYTIALWTSGLYSFGYLLCITFSFFRFLNNLKIFNKIATKALLHAQADQEYIFSITLFSNITI